MLLVGWFQFLDSYFEAGNRFHTLSPAISCFHNFWNYFSSRLITGNMKSLIVAGAGCFYCSPKVVNTLTITPMRL
jgi:hypothetical protein